MQVYDGTGKGYGMEVDKHGRAHTIATATTQLGWVSEHNNDAFAASTDVITFNSTNEHPLLFIKNESGDRWLYFSSIIYSYNGGDTNHNRTMTKRIYRNPPDPTGNYVEITPINMNYSSITSSYSVIYTWDQSDGTDGMEIDFSNQTSMLTNIIPDNVVPDDLNGIILGHKNTMLITYQPEEIGTASISLKYYFYDIK